MQLTRRSTLKLSLAGLATAALPGIALAQIEDLAIAYNVNLPSWDPTTGPSAVNPTIQAIYQAVFDQFIGQDPDLSFKPGILTDWGWNDDRTQVWMDVREGVKWHDGSDLTPEDVVWSLERAADPETGNPIQFTWSTIGNFSVDGNRVTADVLSFDPTIFQWMAFLTGYVLPKAYHEKVGAEGFEQAPVGSGPYMVDTFERNSFVRLKAFPDYWGEKPDFESVTIKFVPDAASRVAEIESGSSHVTLEVPYEEFDRLKDKAGLTGTTTPIVRHRHDLPQRHRADDRPQRAQGGGDGDRQEAADRPAALRLRRPDRHAADAGIRGLRRKRSRSPTTPNRPRRCWPSPVSVRTIRCASPSRPRAASSPRITR